MKELVCIVCPRGCHLLVDDKNDYAVTGNGCPRGAEYGVRELTNPTRTVTSTVRCTGARLPRCPVKTASPIPRSLVLDAVRALDGVTVAAPVHEGDVVLANVCGSGVDFVASRTLLPEE